MRRTTWGPALVLGIAGLAAGCSQPAADGGANATPAGTSAQAVTSTDGQPAGTGAEPDATGTFQDGEGREVGTVEIFGEDGETRIVVEVTGLSPGFHGLHLHGIGECEPDSTDPANPANTGDFLSAGGHIGAGETDHGSHAGDLPSLYVTDDGDGDLVAFTAALAPAELIEDDGTAVMIHENRDNFAHIPERYGTPDEQTRNTGDAGARIACAVLGEE